VSDITARIRRVTEDLQALQAELDEATRKASAQRHAAVDELVEGDLLDDLKNAVDNVRHFLWSYIEATTENPADLRSAMQGYRMQRVTEMLRLLKAEPQLAQSQQAHSFLEELNNIAHAAVERHAEEGEGQPKGGDPAAGPAANAAKK
jgi:molecular chaperone GrpE (heat shock protein)